VRGTTHVDNDWNMDASAASQPAPLRPALPGSVRLLRLASDERLVEQVRVGSQAAFEAIFDRHHRGILAFCRHMLGSAEEAEDAVQHTFMAAYRDMVSSVKEIQLRAWLYTIARNRCLTLLRGHRERPLGELDEPSTESLSAEVERRQDLRELLVDLAGLPEEQRSALVLAEVGAVSHDEIAVVLGVPREKVKALVFQARSSLAASRKARNTPCAEIREQLANLRGGSLRRNTLRRHLRECPGCRDFRRELQAQRKSLALILPVVPTLALKESALAAAFGGGAAAAGGAAAGVGGGAALGTAASAGGSAVVAKALVAVALVGGGTAAGVTANHHAAPGKHSSARPAASATPDPTRAPEARGEGATVQAARGEGDEAGSTKPGTRARTRSHGAKAKRRGHARAPGRVGRTKRHAASLRTKSTGKTRHKAPKKTRAGAKTRGIGPETVTRGPAIPRRRTSPAKPAPTPSPTVAPEPSIRRHDPRPVGQVEVAP
jgi:RNA polymerase sigma factor (sigma-70 family)